ncbi:hypothetical protein FB45DRAFT_825279 [Roridomyces roridus]|uniref:HNH domain-containing protein n=1 Tax=Roridomyces roridus TaxID=1738132 RepID=A0AAD7C799_9AGAR|nr:hypothetical protein FB45DRAFT_825279 [Roridomyces roridus]
MLRTIDSPQFSLFKDCIARRLLSYPDLQNPPQESQELDDFTSYLTQEVWPTLPAAFLTASYETRCDLPEDLDSMLLHSVSGAFVDTLISYGIAEDAEGAETFLRKTLADYRQQACAPPPVWSSTRGKDCEICEREIPLTYHHLIPRSTHAKALKKKWHPESMLNVVAWLCRPCHTMVHSVATNEDLAQNYYSVALLLEREDVQRWGRYASKQRYGVRRG